MSVPLQEVLGSLLLRSSTPVLVFLEQLKSESASTAKSGLDDDFETNLNGDGQEDIASDVQEGAQSAVGSLMQRNGVHHGHGEPGPGDEPGPHYESYGSSFGNFGPMPPESAFDEPAHVARVPPPNSVPVPSPSAKARTSRTGSRASASQKAPSMVSRTQKEAAVALEDTAMSPKPINQVGLNGDIRSPPPQKQSTTYPPLPPSQTHSNIHSNIGSASAAVKYQRAYSRAPSLSPSDSPSQMKAQRNAVRSVGREPSLPPVPPSDGDSQVEGDFKVVYSQQNGDVRSRTAGPSILSNGNNRSQRPFSPYRNGPTEQDLIHAAIHGLSLDAPGHINGSPSKHSHGGTPRALSPGLDELNEEETRLVENVLNQGTQTPRTSYATTSVLEPNQFTHYHDMSLCILLHQLDDPNQHEVVKKAVRKAVKARVKQLGMKYDNETIKQYRKSFHDHDPSVHLRQDYQPPPLPDEPPEWAKELQRGVFLLTQRVDSLGPKIDSIKVSQQQPLSPMDERKYYTREQTPSEMYTQTPLTQTVNIQTHPTGTIGDDSMFQPATDIHIAESTHGQTLPGSMHHHDGSTHGLAEQEEYEDDETEQGHGHYGQTSTQGDTHNRGLSEYTGNRDSPGQQFLEEELYKLRVRAGPGSQSGNTHKTWELARDNGDYEDEDPDGQAAVTESGMQDIPDSNPSGYGDRQVWQQQPPSDYNSEPPQLLPWQRIHQRLLNWAIVWPVSELDNALNSTTRGNQVDEVALSIWSTQTYKRYVRSKMTDGPGGRVDRLFVPPNMADAISNAVFNGRHGDASGMLRELWHPFGLEGMPRLLIVLAKHRSDANHWVVHRFSLPDGTLTTYDSYPERCLPDGRPLGWWFAIRIAWPNAIYPSPDHLMQKMVRLHRPMQLGIDNSVAAAGIWRNLLMGSRAERSLDLERLRDLINTEVKNLRQRKLMGKLSISAPRPNWDDM
ncbi:hypothetical protein B0F90DRAFT_1698852 [Multifurca ochricompacta]|uniref:Uncharacterized protein n=1 Tax=Multifurca ochricompacta TaxID=376703 RepID=A0AAD4M8P1_9AGAM|nr:hypothetical protein B0F90DRAFT_1698852 [Multifurca ochricompacta]